MRSQFYLAAIISTVAALSFSWLTFRLRKIVRARLGVCTYYFYVAVLIVHVFVPLLWIVCLLPPWSNPDNPMYLGGGGAEYGLSYEYYPLAVSLSFVPYLAASLYILLRTYLSSGLALVTQSHLRIATPLFVATAAIGALLTIAIFYSLGWELLIKTPFPPDLYRRSEVSGMFLSSGPAALMLKVGLPMLLLVSLLVTVFSVIRNQITTGGVLSVLYSLPFFAIASRGWAIIAISTVLAITYGNSRSFLIIRTLVAGGLVFAAAVLPLVLRTEGNAGVVWIASRIPYHLNNCLMSSEPIVLPTIGNSTLAMPLLVEGLENHGSSEALTGLSDGYLIRMLSPFPSRIDGYAESYNHEKPKVNEYTPYSTAGELVGIFGPPGIGILALLIVVAIESLVRVSRCGNYGSVFAIAPLILFLIFLASSMQYQVRASSRVFYAGLFVSAAIRCVYKLRNLKIA